MSLHAILGNNGYCPKDLEGTSCDDACVMIMKDVKWYIAKADCDSRHGYLIPVESTGQIQEEVDLLSCLVDVVPHKQKIWTDFSEVYLAWDSGK